MTAEDVKKYAIEKKLPGRAIEDMFRRLKADYPGDIDDLVYHALCAEIDRSSEYWDGVRRFLETPKEERIRRRPKDGGPE